MNIGTRADFYVGKEPKVEDWLGSVAWDGYPKGIPPEIRNARSKESYRKAVLRFLKGREDASFPKDGWPWPWDDSNTTDFAYTFYEGHVRASCFGTPWSAPMHFEKDDDIREKSRSSKDAPVFPNMKDIKNVNFGERSGIIVICAKRE